MVDTSDHISDQECCTGEVILGIVFLVALLAGAAYLASELLSFGSQAIASLFN